MSFTHLHLHTSYSLLDGAGKITEMVKRAKELSQKSMAITDHGVMYGAVEFFRTCLINGIKPIIGAEVYIVSGSRFDRNPNEERYHLVLLCENDIGYKNLLKIVSAGFIDGFYYKPRVDYEILSKYHNGLICLSACLAGEIPKALIKKDYAEAKLKAENMKSIFGKNNFFIEIQNHNIKDEIAIQPDLIRLANDINVPLVATNDVHYTYKEDSFCHDCLLCLQTGKKLSDSNRMTYAKEKFYITSEDEMNELFTFCPEAVTNTELIANRCNVHFEFTKSAYGDLISIIDKNKQNGVIEGDVDIYKSMIKKCEYNVPIFKIPQNYTNESYLTYLVTEGAKRKYEIVTGEIQKRLDYELNMIIKMGFVDYFLIVWDYIHFAKTNDIPVGPGRGSAVGSLVAYVLDITDIDPIQYGLFFERFLNPERVSMPDIDTDFCVIGRDDVIEYVKKQYGKSNVAQIVTFGTLAPKQVLKDMGRVQGVSLDKAQGLANLIAKRPMLDADKKKANLYKMLHSSIEDFAPIDRDNVLQFRAMYDGDEEVRLMVDTSLRIEGIPRNASVHASGVLIAPEDISNYVPFARGKEELSKDEKALGKKTNDEMILVTEYDMTTLEQLGLLKMDFLGLRNVTAIKDCINLLKNKNVDLDFKKIPYDDKEVFRMISMGDTLGVFQLESNGMTSFMRQLKPTVLEDLIAGISLYRPGPMDFIPKYIDGKKNADTIVYDTPKLEKILKPTYGCIVYQEQVMQIVQELAGYTLGRADEVRRAMSKKKTEKIIAERKNFIYGNEELNIKGCIANGISEDIGNKIFDELIKFALYAFNKSHASAYAVLAYQTAYLKCHYKAEFYTSICNSVLFNRDKLSAYVGSIILNGIKILPVDINKSYDEFIVEDGNIRMGFAALKRVGANISYEIIDEREKNGLYKGFKDAIKRISLRGGNKNAFEALIMCGAFDEFDGNRNQKMHIFPRIIEINQNQLKSTMPGEMNIFDVMVMNGISDENYETTDEDLLKEYSDVKDYTEDEKLFTEKDYTGMFISGHPLGKYLDFINKNIHYKSIDFIKDENENVDIKDGEVVSIVGIIDDIKKFRTKRTNEVMAIISLSDMQGSFEVLLFPKKYTEFSDIVEKNKIVYIEGKFNIDDKDDSGKIYVDKFVDLNEYIIEQKEKTEPGKVKLKLIFTNKSELAKTINVLQNILVKHKGKDFIELILRESKEMKILKELPIKFNDDLVSELIENYGKINVNIVEDCNKL